VILAKAVWIHPHHLKLSSEPVLEPRVLAYSCTDVELTETHPWPAFGELCQVTDSVGIGVVRWCDATAGQYQ